MRARYYALLNVGWTIGYFTYWGLVYGALLGLVTGTALMPIFGSLAGTVCGLLIGTGCGVIVGLAAALFHSLYFTYDTPLAPYRRLLSRSVGGVFLLVGAIGLMVFVKESYRPSWSFEWLFLFYIAVLPILWASLSMAYTASYYPDQIVYRLIDQNHMLDSGAELLEDPTAIRQINECLDARYPCAMHSIGACLGVAGAILLMLSNPHLPINGVMLLSLSPIVGAFTLFVLTAHGAVGSTLAIEFLKRVVVEDVLSGLSSHQVRVMLTLMAFVLTMVLTWWLVLLAPIFALFIAYRVYHTIALPDTRDEKAKRKEKVIAV